MVIDTTKVEDIDDDAEHDENETTMEEILEQARERYKLVAEVEEKQRERERQALRFQVPELQWSDEERQARRGNDGSPPRPILSVSKLDQPIGLVINQMRNADLGVEVHPVSEDSDSDNAEARQGLYRYIERDSHAELVRAWAFERAVKAGRGWYRVLTEYDPEGGDPSDQKIVIKRILQQDGVYADPAANEPDYSDGEFAFVMTWMPKAQFKRKWPKSVAAKAERLQWEGIRKEAPDWVRGDDVLVAEYWYVVHTPEKFEVNGEERQRDKRTVYCAYVTGWEVLEEPYRWPGQWIPLVPVVGRELQSFDEERRFVGMIEPAMGAQKFFNFSITSLVERMALEPKAPWVANAEVIEGFEDIWAQSNIRNFPVLPFNHVVKDGQPLPPPVRATIDQSGMSISLMAAQQADALIQSATAVFSPSLGQEDPKNRSGKAILALQSQADAGTSHFIQNLADISITYEAKVIMDLMPHIYDRPERIVRIVRGDEKKVEPIMINAPFVMDPRTKRPVPAPPQPSPGMMRGPMPGPGPAGPPMPGMPPPPPAPKHYKLTAGTYGVSVTVGKSFQTRLQEGSERMGELMGSRPDLFVAMGDLWLQFQDFPGAKEMSKRMAKWREKAMPGLGEGEEGGASVEQLQAQLDGMKAQGQQMQQQLQMAVQQIQTDQAKQQAAIMKAQMDAQASMAKAQLEADTKLRVSAADNETKLMIAQLTQEMHLMLETLGLKKEAMIAERQAEDDERERQHQAAMAGREVAVKAMEGQQTRAFQASQTREQADREARQAERQRQHEAGMAFVGSPAPEAPERPVEEEEAE